MKMVLTKRWLGGGLTRERTEEIMKDSRLGTYNWFRSPALLLKISLLAAMPLSVFSVHYIVGILRHAYFVLAYWRYCLMAVRLNIAKAEIQSSAATRAITKRCIVVAGSY